MFQLIKTKLSVVALVLAGLTVPAGAQELYVVHAINGTDLGLDESLLVDIELDGVGALEDVPFTGVAGPVPVSVGAHSVVVRLSDGVSNSFTGTVVLDETVTVAAFETAVVAANLDPNFTIRLTKFTADARPLADGDARITIAHAASAPTVDVKIRGTQGTKGRANIVQIESGGQSDAAPGPNGTYNFTIKPSFSKGLLAKLSDVAIDGNVVIVAAGSVENGTFTVIPVAIAND